MEDCVIKLWIDDVRPAPEGYVRYRTVNNAIYAIEHYEQKGELIELIDTDYDAGIFARDGGDYICLLDWLEQTGRNYPIRIHSANAVGVANMRAIIERNGWKEIQ